VVPANDDERMTAWSLLLGPGQDPRFRGHALPIGDCQALDDVFLGRTRLRDVVLAYSRGSTESCSPLELVLEAPNHVRARVTECGRSRESSWDLPPPTLAKVLDRFDQFRFFEWEHAPATSSVQPASITCLAYSRHGRFRVVLDDRGELPHEPELEALAADLEALIARDVHLPCGTLPADPHERSRCTEPLAH
jgi:hypothetical protein